MGKQIFRSNFIFIALVSIGIMVAMTSVANAQRSSSPNYQVDETFFGTGGQLEASSTNYKAKQSAGELAVGAMRSSIYSAQAGFNTDRTPYIAAASLTPTVDVGVLDTGHANVGTAQFWVKAYLADGYVVQSYGGSPKTGGHSMVTSATNFSSTPGTEQFGINLAVNTIAGAMTGTPLTSMTNFGAEPSQAPDDASNPFGFGQVDPDYDTTNSANQFKYIDGDPIALSTRSSSDTTFTISYLFNISSVTRAGTYVMNHSVVATATF